MGIKKTDNKEKWLKNLISYSVGIGRIWKKRALAFQEQLSGLSDAYDRQALLRTQEVALKYKYASAVDALLAYAIESGDDELFIMIQGLVPFHTGKYMQ